MASTINKIKAKVDNVLHKDDSTTGGDPTGPHHSHAGNKADPRVDSDHIGTRDTSGAGGVGSGQYTQGSHTTGHHTTGGLTGTTGTHGTHGTSGYSDPTGPHDSRLANKADPRVDSDRIGAQGNTSGAGGIGGGQYTGGSHTTGHTTGGGLTGHSTTGGLTGHSTTGGYGNTGGDPTGPHSSRTANVLDPRVDSDRVGAQGNTAGAGGYGTGQYGEGHGTTGHGTTGHGTTGHGTTGYGTTGHGTTGGYSGSTPGTGTAPNTAGPHNSDLLNKADPRVDSDMSGGKTYGGNQTYQ